MIVPKFLLKILALPVWLVLTLAVWFGLFVTGFSSTVFYILSGICFFVAMFCWSAQYDAYPSAWSTLILGFCLFALPLIATRILVTISDLRDSIGDFILS